MITTEQVFLSGSSLLKTLSIIFIIMSLNIYTVQGQNAISIGATYFNRESFDRIITKRPDLERFRFARRTFRTDLTIWQTEKIGLGLGFQMHKCMLGFRDTDPIRGLGFAHSDMTEFLIPLNIIYRIELFKIFKRPLYLHAQGGIIVGINPHAVKNLGPLTGSYLLTADTLRTYYNYSLNYDFSPVFLQLDMGLRLDYQIGKTFSIGFQARYYQGLEKIGTLDASYRVEGYPAKNVQVETLGSNFMIGIGAQFHIPIKKKLKTPESK